MPQIPGLLRRSFQGTGNSKILLPILIHPCPVSNHIYSVLMKPEVLKLSSVTWCVSEGLGHCPQHAELCPHALQHHSPVRSSGTCVHSSSDSLVLLGLEQRFKGTRVHRTEKAAMPLADIKSSPSSCHVVFPLIGMGRVGTGDTYPWCKYYCVWLCHVLSLVTTVIPQ